MSDKILVLGDGYIGKKISSALQCSVSDDMINSYEDVEKIINKYNPDVVINCIGAVGSPNVDGCEEDKQATLMANTFIPIMLGEASFRHRFKLVHISSGCIFDYDYEKDEPVDEYRVPDYYDLFYSRSKIYTETALAYLSEKSDMLILRIRVPLEDDTTPRNIITKLIGFKDIIKVPNSITYLPDFIEALKHLLDINASGFFNVVNGGAVCMNRIVDEYKKYFPEHEYNSVEPKDLDMNRTNLLMSNSKLEKTGFKMRSIEEILPACMENYIKKLGD